MTIEKKDWWEGTVFKVGEKIPLKGFWFEVVSTDTHDVLLTVCGVSKAGEKLGYKVTPKP